MEKNAYSPEKLKILNLLAKEYPSIESVSSAIVNLSATAALPKGH